jgi:hypothetical protein
VEEETITNQVLPYQIVKNTTSRTRKRV